MVGDDGGVVCVSLKTKEFSFDAAIRPAVILMRRDLWGECAAYQEGKVENGKPKRR